eukprot:4711540-Amphidinium_carterae.1
MAAYSDHPSSHALQGQPLPRAPAHAHFRSSGPGPSKSILDFCFFIANFAKLCGSLASRHCELSPAVRPEKMYVETC